MQGFWLVFHYKFFAKGFAQNTNGRKYEGIHFKWGHKHEQVYPRDNYIVFLIVALTGKIVKLYY